MTGRRRRQGCYRSSLSSLEYRNLLRRGGPDRGGSATGALKVLTGRSGPVTIGVIPVLVALSLVREGSRRDYRTCDRLTPVTLPPTLGSPRSAPVQGTLDAWVTVDEALHVPTDTPDAPLESWGLRRPR